jgi:hypothetical protein
MTTNAFIISWCSEGLESVIPITQYENIDIENTFKILKDEEPQLNPLDAIIKKMLIRARVNSQRHYEIYAINCEDTITEQDLRNMFESDPQGIADLVRQRGHKLYGDRRPKKSREVIN